MKKKLNILLVEDRIEDLELVRYELRRTGIEYNGINVQTETEYLNALTRDLDIILADYSLPQFNAPRALELLKKSGLDIPIIVVTGTISEEVAVGCIKQGAFDYLLKDRLSRLGQAISHALQEKQLRLEKRRGDERIRFMLEAGAILASSFDYTRNLEKIVQLAVPLIADCCYIELTEDKGKKVESSCSTPDHDSRWMELVTELSSEEGLNIGPAAVRNTGRPQMFSCTDLERLGLGTKDQRDCSFLSVPVKFLSRQNGTITLVSRSKDRPYDQPDVDMAMELARRVGLAVEHARLYFESQESNRIKDEFLATVSHELRTPLTAILGWARLLRTTSIDKENVARAIETIERNAKLQATLVEDLLDVSRIITGKLRLNIKNLHPASIIDACIDATRHAADAKQIKLEKVVSPTVGFVKADPDRLQQVIWNLITNAIKFTPEGGLVEVKAESIDQRVVISVSDTGMGISREFLPHVFDRFRQADGSITRRHGGMGLGLAIVRHVVEMHGGIVYASSNGEGQGAVFTVELPEAVALVDAHDLNERADNKASEVENLYGLKVLVLEDEPDTRHFITVVLEQANADVCSASSVAEALDCIKKERPDIIVSDLGMPGEDGFDFIKRLQILERENGWKMPAIALTAFTRMEDRLRALSAGFQMHIAKPIEPAELITVVGSVSRSNGKGMAARH
jgi:signal transduction histidine kinase/DNA-binding response OmpR family regulator